MRFNESGIHLRGVDPSQVVLVDFSIPSSSFKKFVVEPSLVGIDLSELDRILSRVQPSESLLLDVTESELKINVLGEFEKNFSLPLIDISYEEVTLPKIKFESSVEITSRILKEALKDASIFGSLVVFRTEKNSFFLEANGSHGTMSCMSKEGRAIKVNSSKDTVSKFSLNFLQNIVREVDPEHSIFLELKNDSPLKVSFSIGTARFEFFLAHMIL